MVALEARIPPSAFTAGALGTERLGNGVVIGANGLVLTMSYLLMEAAFTRAVRLAAPDTPGEDHPDASEDDAKVLRSFVRDGRLLSMPASHAKRMVVLDHIVQAFEPGIRYTEKQVNAILVSWYQDTATLRRYLVDAGFLSREAGEYWRTGGSVRPLS